MTRVIIYNTTLSDGAQTEGVSFFCKDKLNIPRRLDGFGVDFVEGGWPGFNPRNDEFFQMTEGMDLSRTVLTAFSSAPRHRIPSEENPNLRALSTCSAEWYCIFGKSGTSTS